MNHSNENTIDDLKPDNEVEPRARTLFKTACENTDSYHALRLGLARRKALDAGSKRHATWLWAPLAGGAVACCALVVGLALLRPGAPATPRTAIAPSAPIAMGQADGAEELPELGSAQTDMVQDLDFYRWLAAQPTVATATPRSAR